MGGGSGARGRRGFRVLPLILFAGVLLYYVNIHQQRVPVTGRTQIVDISKEAEAQLGLSAYQEILSGATLITEGPEYERVQRVARRLAAAVEDSDIQWQFNLIRSRQANAFALPGGLIAVYSGILPVAKNDAGLAAILGHEMAHVIARHGAERMTHERLRQLGGVALSSSVGEMDPTTRNRVMGAFGLGSQYGVMLPFSRKHESEADLMGLLYLARACFNPEEAPQVWQRMKEAGDGGSPLELLSTHPAHDTRIEELQAQLPQARKLYSSSCPRS